MKIACLVLGYEAEAILACSLPVLHTAGFDVFLHLDAKIDHAGFMKILGSAGTKCRVLEQHIDIFWGGYSMMLAGLKLLEAARDAGPYDRYVLISDDSFPILPADALAAHFAQNEDLITMVRQPEGNIYCERYEKFFCYDHPATTARGHGIRSLEIDEAFERKIAEIAVLRRIGKKKVDVYFGSQFWSLTQPTAEMLLRIAHDDLHLVKSFEYAGLPDELMAQTIIGMAVGADSNTGPVFEDFPRGTGPTVFSSIEQLPFLDSRYAFLRKIKPDAVDFAIIMADRLMRGLSIFGSTPGLAHFGTLITDEDGKLSINIRLSAPVENTGGWHAVESYLDRDFRWTASNRMEWQFRLPTTLPVILSFYMPLVIEDRPHIFENCYVRVNGLSQKMTHGAGGLNAMIDYDGGEQLTVIVVTPPPIMPRDENPESNDDRMIGLSVAL